MMIGILTDSWIEFSGIQARHRNWNWAQAGDRNVERSIIRVYRGGLDIIVGVLSTWHRYNWERMVCIIGKHGRLYGRYILNMGGREERVGWYMGVLY